MVTSGQRAGALLSVNVGLPQDVTWQGRTVHTAVWKKPVTGPQMVRRLNIDGDGQGDLAGHGGEQRAVFVYQTESYQYWQQQLGRDDFSYGQFGENFTVQGLADDQVCIGDRYQIGGAVFEVTQPRVTCFRVGIRMDDPQMPALLVSQHRPGFYFRVLTEGAVEAGQEIIKVASGPEGMTVAEMDALLYLPGHPRQQLLRALRIPALSGGWKASFQEMLDQSGQASGNAGLAEASPPPAWPGFRPFAVTAIDQESETVISLHLADPGGGTVPAARPGQFLTLRLHPDPAGPPLLRSYSLSGPPGARDYRISVKREEHGAASQFIHTRVRAGDQLEAAAPRGTFTLRPGQAPVLLISAGVGATPVLAMLHALAAAKSTRDIWWLHSARRRADEPFAAESRALLAALPSAHRHICYSSPGPDDVLGPRLRHGGTPVGAGPGRPGPAPRRRCLPVRPGRVHGRHIRCAGRGRYRRGPHPHRGLRRRARADTRHRARGRPPAAPARRPAGRGPLVAFARSDLSARWDPGYASLLEFAEACDVPVRWSCRVGVCHTCETTLISGKVRYAPAPVDAPADGDLLICCSQPTEDLVLDL